MSSAALFATAATLSRITAAWVFGVFSFPFFKPLALRGRHGGAEGRRGYSEWGMERIKLFVRFKVE